MVGWSSPLLFSSLNQYNSYTHIQSIVGVRNQEESEMLTNLKTHIRATDHNTFLCLPIQHLSVSLPLSSLYATSWRATRSSYRRRAAPPYVRRGKDSCRAEERQNLSAQLTCYLFRSCFDEQQSGHAQVISFFQGLKRLEIAIGAYTA